TPFVHSNGARNPKALVAGGVLGLAVTTRHNQRLSITLNTAQPRVPDEDALGQKQCESAQSVSSRAFPCPSALEHPGLPGDRTEEAVAALPQRSQTLPGKILGRGSPRIASGNPTAFGASRIAQPFPWLRPPQKSANCPQGAPGYLRRVAGYAGTTSGSAQAGARFPSCQALFGVSREMRGAL